jgi:hypothetical protein
MRSTRSSRSWTRRAAISPAPTRSACWRRIGIIKDQPFTPDAHAREILDRAAKTAYKTSRVIGFQDMLNGGSLRVYSDRRWLNPLDNITPSTPRTTMDLTWKNVAGNYRELDARIWFFTDYYAVSPDALENARQGRRLPDGVHRRCGRAFIGRH